MISFNDINNSVRENRLTIREELVDHTAYTSLMTFLEHQPATFTEVKVISGEESELLILGESEVFSLPLKDAEFYIFKAENNREGFGFEWSGLISRVEMDQLYSLKLLQTHPSAVLPALLTHTFEKIEFLYSYSDQKITLAAYDPDFKLEFPSLGLGLSEIGFFYETDIIGESSRYRLNGEFKIGTTFLPFEIEIPSGNQDGIVCWSLATTDEIILDNGITDLSSFFSDNALLKSLLGDGQLNEYLPEEVRKINELYIFSFFCSFDPTFSAIYIINITINYYADWEIIPGFVLNNIGLNIFVTFHGKEIACTLKLFGSYSFIEDWFVNFSFTLPLNKTDNWIIQLEGFADLENLQQLESLNLFKLENLNLPPRWLQVNDIRLHHFVITFNPWEGKVKGIELEVEMKAESELIPGIKISDPKLELSLTFD